MPRKVIYRKDLNRLVEKVMTTQRTEELETKVFHMKAIPIIEQDYWEDRMVGFTLTYRAKQD